MMQVRPPMASWRPRQAARAAVVPRHERPNSVHRRRYYSHHWPERARRDLFERPGRWIALWTAVGVLGLAATVATPLAGDDAPVVGMLNLGVLVLLLVAHTVNAIRTRRRRSVLMSPVLLLAVGTAAHAHGGVGPRSLDALTAVFFVWLPIAAADVVAPSRTYLAPVATTES
ncbi:MAG: hypothetical protein RI958_800 [Actinomycetota bacterium]|jgi:hypothetical protein